MAYLVQAITVDGDVANETQHSTQEEAYEFADCLTECFCRGWRPGGKVVVSDRTGELRVCLLGDDNFDNDDDDTAFTGPEHPGFLPH